MDKSDRWNKQATRNPICRESQTPRDMTQDFLQLAPLWFHPCVRRHMYCSSLPVQCFGLWWARYRKSPAVKWLFSIRKSWWIFSNTSFSFASFASFTLHRVNSISQKKESPRTFPSVHMEIPRSIFPCWPQVCNHKSHLGDLGDIGVETPLLGDLNSGGWAPTDAASWSHPMSRKKCWRSAFCNF